MRRPVLISILFALFSVCQWTGCKPADKEKSGAPPAPVIQPSPAAKPGAAAPPVMEQRPRRDILVGGCNDACDEPNEAIAGFLRACAGPDNVNNVRQYVNTAALIHNTVKHGDTWAALFMERRLGKRRKEIDNWLNEWLGWVDRITDPADRQKVSEGVEVVEENQQRFVANWRHPDLEPSPNGVSAGPVWRIVLRKRGLEWLVAEILERP
jgi:hypothetical protein